MEWWTWLANASVRGRRECYIISIVMRLGLAPRNRSVLDITCVVAFNLKLFYYFSTCVRVLNYCVALVKKCYYGWKAANSVLFTISGDTIVGHIQHIIVNSHNRIDHSDATFSPSIKFSPASDIGFSNNLSYWHTSTTSFKMRSHYLTMLLLLLLAVVSAAFSFNPWSLVHRNSSFTPFVANLFSTPPPETYEPSSTAEEHPEEILLDDIQTDWSWENSPTGILSLLLPLLLPSSPSPHSLLLSPLRSLLAHKTLLRA